MNLPNPCLRAYINQEAQFARKTRRPSGRNTFTANRIHKPARNAVIIEIGKSLYNYAKDVAEKIKTDNKLFWKHVKDKK